MRTDYDPRTSIAHGNTEQLILLMYAPDMSDWFFCEVKGPGDRLRSEQMSKFEALAEVSGEPVRLMHLKWASDPGRTATARTVPP